MNANRSLVDATFSFRVKGQEKINEGKGEDRLRFRPHTRYETQQFDTNLQLFCQVTQAIKTSHIDFSHVIACTRKF